MRASRRTNEIDILNRDIFLVGVLFILSIVFGTYLNKILPNSGELLDKLTPAIDFYNSDINILSVVSANVKSDLIFIGLVSISSLFVVTLPVAVAIFLFKGVSIGYTINTMIITLKINSANLIALMLIKNLIFIPCIVLLLVLSLNYVKKIIVQFTRPSRMRVSYLVGNYIKSAFAIASFCLVFQTAVNAIGTCIFKYFIL
ncbi:MAG: stage II sporulation protein M [Clostridioides sp.]|nr:stage II sporulation protein M [Clostridioides sp.]